MADVSVVDEINVIFNADISRFSSALSSAQSQLNNTSNAFNNAGKALNAFANLVGLKAIVSGVEDLASAAVDAYAKLQQVTIGFTALTGSADKATALIKEINSISWTTPIDSVYQMAQGMLGVGFNSENVLGVLKSVNDAAAALGTGATGANALSNAIDKIAATGKVTALGIRPLIAQHINAYQMLADYLKTTVTDAEEKVKKGSISAAIGIAAISTGLEAKFGEAAKAQADTIGGMFARIKNDVTIILQAIGKEINSLSLGPILKQVIQFMDELAALTQQGKTVGQALQLMLPPALIATFQLLGLVVAGSVVASFASLAIRIYEVTAAAAPWIIAGTTIVAIGYLLYTNWDKVGNTLLAVAAVISAAVAISALFNTQLREMIVNTVTLIAEWVAANAGFILTVGALVGLVAVIAIAVNSWNTFSALVGNVGIYISDAIVRMVNNVKAAFTILEIDIADSVNAILNWLGSFVDSLGPFSSMFSGTLNAWAGSVQNWRNNLVNYYGSLTSGTQAAVENQIGLWNVMGDQVGTIADDTIAKVKSIIDAVKGLFTSSFKPPVLPPAPKIAIDPSQFASMADAAQNAGKKVKTAIDKMATGADILSEQIKDLNDQLEIWRITNGLASDSVVYMNKKIQTLGEEQTLAAQKVQVLSQALVDEAAKYGTASKKFVEGESALSTAQLDWAKLTEEINNAQIAISEVNATAASDQIKVIQDALEIWRIQNKVTTDSTKYMTEQLKYLQMEQVQAKNNIVALNDKLNELSSTADGNSKAFLDANAAVGDAELQFYQLGEQIDKVKAKLSGVASGTQWVSITSHVSELTLAIADLTKAGENIHPGFGLPTNSEGYTAGALSGSGVTAGFQSGMQMHSPSLIERTLMAISAQAKKTFSDINTIAPGFGDAAAKMTAGVSSLMTTGTATTGVIPIAQGGLTPATNNALANAAKTSTSIAGAGVMGGTASQQGAMSGSPIHVNQLIVREEADLQRIARLLFRMQQNQLRPRGITP